MNTTDLKAQYEILKAQLAQVNAQISVLISKNKKYSYSNIETSHSVEAQSITDLMKLKKDILAEMADIESKFRCSFVKVKNY